EVAVVDDRDRTEGRGRQTHHPIADREAPHAIADLDDDPGGLVAELAGLAVLQAEGEGHVDVVEARGPDRYPNLERTERARGLRSLGEHQAVERAAGGHAQLPGRRAGRRRELIERRRASEP